MILVFYHADYNALRLYYTQARRWADMMEYGDQTHLHSIVAWGWELVGEL